MGWSGFLDGHCLDASFGANLFQFRLPLCLQFVDGDHDQAESGKGFCQTKCPHMKGSMVGACNHAMAFLKCVLEWFLDGHCLDASFGANLIPIPASSLPAVCRW